MITGSPLSPGPQTAFKITVSRFVRLIRLPPTHTQLITVTGKRISSPPRFAANLKHGEHVPQPARDVLAWRQWRIQLRNRLGKSGYGHGDGILDPCLGADIESRPKGEGWIVEADEYAILLSPGRGNT